MLASIGSVGDAYDNALAESFVDSFKTELIADRVWRTRTQLELAIVEYVGWFNDEPTARGARRRPPAEFERLSQTSTLEISLINEKREPTKPGLRETQPGSNGIVDRLQGQFFCLTTIPWGHDPCASRSAQ